MSRRLADRECSRCLGSRVTRRNVEQSLGCASGYGGRMTEETGLDEIRRARHDLDAVIEEIRQQPGYADFLAAPTFDDISEAAQEYPLVYLAAAEPGGLALIVRGT